jgi:hypothetical protein
VKDIILTKAAEAGRAFASISLEEPEELDEIIEGELREAIMTDHVTPDQIAEAFVVSMLEGLGLENNLETRRDDKVDAVLSVFSEVIGEKYVPEKAAMRRFAERIVDAIAGKKEP